MNRKVKILIISPFISAIVCLLYWWLLLSGFLTGFYGDFVICFTTVMTAISVLTMSAGLLMSIIGTVMAVRNKLKNYIKLGLISTIFLLASTIWVCWQVYLAIVVFKS